MNRLLPSLYFVLALALAACDPQPASPLPGSPVPDGGAVATQVAIRLTAAAQATVAAAGSPLQPAPLQTDLAGKVMVVYSRAGNLQLWDGAASKQLTASGQDTDPRLSDDNRVVVFRRGPGLWAVNTDGTGERSLASPAALSGLPHTGGGALQADRLAFAPHTHDLYFNTIALPGAGSNPSPSPNQDLVKLNADNPTLQPLLNDSQGGAGFTFSPDGTQIALARHDSLNVFKPGGSLKTVFTYASVPLGTGLPAYVPQVAWMPDGSGFKTVIPGPDAALSSPAMPARFMFVSADGGPAAQLAEFPALATAQLGPVISPDGAQVLYVKRVGTSLELHVVDASTADKAYGQFPAGGIDTLHWAPDSLHFDYHAAGSIWLGSLAGQPVRLQDAAQITWLDPNHYLFVDHANLRLGHPGQPTLLLASGVDPAFAFVLSP